MRNKFLLVAFAAALEVSACGRSGGGGGRGGTTGVPGVGGVTSGGGASGGSGGALTGGVLGPGGQSSPGGVAGAVDAAAAGGSGNGGATGRGGTLSSGGATGVGGTGVTTGGAAGGGAGGSSRGAGGAQGGPWSMGYYASWKQDQYPISEIEWSGLTHIAMAFYTPKASGTLSLMGGAPSLEKDLVLAAHQNGVKAVASIGGADSQSDFKAATASGVIATFVANLVALMTTSGYDGIDIDWEPLDTADEPTVIDIATRIRKAKPDALLTIPVGEINANLGANLANYTAIGAAYDQLNIMSYGQAGIWQGWKSWHSSALYHTDTATPTSIDSAVTRYLIAAVPPSKLGIGIGFYGLCYTSPVTGPNQPLGNSTIAASDGTMSYANIMTKYWSESARKWDELARVPYLSFSSPHAPDNCTYISYDDEQSIAEKGAYVKAKGLGGVIQWELSEGYLPSAAAGQRNPLLKAIRGSVLH